jgi:hypothetical protein
MPRRLTKRCDVTRQIRTSVAIKPLNLLDLAAEIDVVAALSPATIFQTQPESLSRLGTR